jgi:hypothetical protein
MAKQAVSTRDRPVALVEDIEGLLRTEMTPPRSWLDPNRRRRIGRRGTPE